MCKSRTWVVISNQICRMIFSSSNLIQHLSLTGSHLTWNAPVLNSNETGVCRIESCVYGVVLIPVCNFAISYPWSSVSSRNAKNAQSDRNLVFYPLSWHNVNNNTNKSNNLKSKSRDNLMLTLDMVCFCRHLDWIAMMNWWWYCKLHPRCPCRTCNPIQQPFKLLGQCLALHFLTRNCVWSRLLTCDLCLDT